MRVEYDRQADSAYIYLVDKIAPGQAKKQEICGELPDVILDFDEGGLILGIEVLGASRLLPRELLQEAEVIDD